MRWRRLAPIAALAATAWLSGPDTVEAAPADDGSIDSDEGPTEPPEVAAVSDALVLEPGATCLEHDRLTEQVVTWLERDELDPRLTVVVEGDPSVVDSLRFTLRDRGEVIAERVFHDGPSRCEDFHSVVALAIALAVDATVLESVGIVPEVESVPEPEPPEPPAEPKPVPVSKPSVVPPSPGPDLTPRDRPWRLRVRAGGLVTVGLPPPLGGGAELGLELSWRELVDVQASVLGASAGPQPVDGGSTLQIGLVAGRADVCGGPRIRRVRPRFCGGLIAGSAMAEGRGFVHDYQVVLPWVALAFGGDLRVSVMRRLDLSFDLDGVVTTVRPVFDVREELEVRKLRDLPRFGALFGMGLVVSFGEGPGRARP